MKKVRLILALFYGILGLAFLLGGTVIEVRNHAQTQNMIAVEGTIVAIHDNVPTIVYHVNGEPYSTRSNVASALYHVGDTYRVLTDPDNPAQAIDPGAQLLTRLLFGIGGVLLLGALLTHLFSRRNQERLAILRASGIRRQGTVTQVCKNYDIDVNNHHPWEVTATCVHPRTGETVTAYEPAVWKTTLQPGDSIDVLFDPIDDKVFMLDIEEK